VRVVEDFRSVTENFGTFI